MAGHPGQLRPPRGGERLRFALALTAVAACAAAPEAPPRAPSGSSAADSALASSLDRQAPAILASERVPSIAVAYVRDGAVRWSRVYGHQSDGVPATPQTLYNVASLAKPLSAELILRLAANGRVSLDEPLAGFWVDPDVAGDSRHRLLTLRIVLSHQTGFKNWRRETGGVLRFEFTPGTGFGYSGEGYEYAKRFVEKKLGTSWDSLASRYLFEPLAMRNTSYVTREWFADRIAIPLGPEGEYGKPFIRDSASASDDLYTTVGDYAAFLVEVMGRDHLAAAYAAQRDSLHVVNPQATADCEPVVVPRCPTRIGMGLGWEILEFPGEAVRLHTGGDWGEKTLVLYLPRRREGAVMFTNGANGLKVILQSIGILFPGTDIAALARSKQ